jgi:hypothetical protein
MVASRWLRVVTPAFLGQLVNAGEAEQQEALDLKDFPTLASTAVGNHGRGVWAPTATGSTCLGAASLGPPPSRGQRVVAILLLQCQSARNADPT